MVTLKYSDNITICPNVYRTFLGIGDMALNEIQELISDCRIAPVDYSDISIESDDKKAIERAKSFILSIESYLKINEDEELSSSTIHELYRNSVSGKKEERPPKYQTVIRKYGSGDAIKPKTSGQAAYVNAIEKNLITIVNGPAGTGKSLLAVAMACKALKNRDIDHIVLTRPVVEAGESLGFLPGDLQEKIDPYMRPLYDALYDILGKPNVDNMIAKGIIEIAPLAYMRGRTMHDAFVILDEAQNATGGQLKMFLTRFGQNCKMVVDMDPTQIDLPKKSMSCYQDIHLFESIKDMAVVTMTGSDISRHPIIHKILNAYERKGENE